MVQVGPRARTSAATQTPDAPPIAPDQASPPAEAVETPKPVRRRYSVEIPIDLKFAERFVASVSWRDEEQHELQEADLNLSVFDGQGIELDDLVKEEILLAVPGHILCREDCKGLCPVCGIDRNRESCDCGTGQIDSRWEKLKDLRF